MNAAERKELQRVTVLLVAGDRSAALAIVRALKEPPRRVMAPEATQLLLPCITFRCETLAVDNLPVHVCVTRQKVTDLQRTQQASRGQGTDYPHCDSRTCAQGRELRERLSPSVAIRWKGAGPGGRFDRGRPRTLAAVPTVEEEE